jgi:hypothetical protein
MDGSNSLHNNSTGSSLIGALHKATGRLVVVPPLKVRPFSPVESKLKVIPSSVAHPAKLPPNA